MILFYNDFMVTQLELQKDNHGPKVDREQGGGRCLAKIDLLEDYFRSKVFLMNQGKVEVRIKMD